MGTSNFPLPLKFKLSKLLSHYITIETLTKLLSHYSKHYSHYITIETLTKSLSHYITILHYFFNYGH